MGEEYAFGAAILVSSIFSYMIGVYTGRRLEKVIWLANFTNLGDKVIHLEDLIQKGNRHEPIIPHPTRALRDLLSESNRH